MNVILNTYCNLKCPYCFAEDAKDEYGKNSISLEYFQYYLDWLMKNKIGNIQLIGGEPTINPNFTKYCDLILATKKIKHILLFTNGLFNDEIADYLKELSKQVQLELLINVNDPLWLGEDRYAIIKKNINKLLLTSKISLGINLYSSNQSYEYIIDLAEEVGIYDVRFSLTIPNVNANIDDFKLHFNNNKSNILNLFKYAAYKHIHLYQDCNSIPYCFLSKEDLSDFIKWYPSLFEKSVCDKVVIDIGPDLKVYKCFGFTDPDNAPYLYEFNTLNDIYSYFKQTYNKIEKTLLVDDCKNCGTYLLKGQSCGCWKYRQSKRC